MTRLNYTFRIIAFTGMVLSMAPICFAFQVSSAMPDRITSPAQSRQMEVRKPELRQSLLQRMDQDQRARKAVVDSIKASIDGKPSALMVDNSRRIDQANREWLRTQIELVGWPLISDVGEDGANAAWLIAQHSDDDRDFQRTCLDLMQKAPNGEVAKISIAYLVDEVLLSMGKKQQYGTQVMRRGGEFRPAAVDEPENLDARRASIGLQSMEVYLSSLRENYANASGNTTKR